MVNFELCFVLALVIVVLSCFVRYLVNSLNKANDSHAASIIMVLYVFALAGCIYAVANPKTDTRIAEAETKYTAVKKIVKDANKDIKNAYSKLENVYMFDRYGEPYDSTRVFNSINDATDSLDKLLKDYDKIISEKKSQDTNYGEMLAYGFMYSILDNGERRTINYVIGSILGIIITYFAFCFIFLQAVLTIKVSKNITNRLKAANVPCRYDDLNAKLNDTVFYDITLFIAIIVVGYVIFGYPFFIGAVIATFFGICSSTGQCRLNEGNLSDFVEAYGKYFEVEGELLYKISLSLANRKNIY